MSASTGMGQAMDKVVSGHEMTVDTKCPTPLINEEECMPKTVSPLW